MFVCMGFNQCLIESFNMGGNPKFGLMVRVSTRITMATA